MDDVDEFLSDMGAFQGSALGSQLDDMRRQRTTARAATTAAANGAGPTTKNTEPQRRQRDENAPMPVPVPLPTPTPLSAAAKPPASTKQQSSKDAVWRCKCCTLDNPAAVSTCNACEYTRNAYMCATCSKVVIPTISGERGACRLCGVRGVPPPPPPREAAAAAAAAALPECEVIVVGSDTESEFQTSEDEVTEEETDEEDDGNCDTDPGAGVDDHPTDDGGESHGEQVQALMKLLGQRCAQDKLPPAPAPKTMAIKGQLRPFQLQALRWMVAREGDSMANTTAAIPPQRALEMVGGGDCRGGILADFMGYGKTRSVIALCEDTRSAARAVSGAVVYGAVVRSRATLIVCPVSLISHWCAEIERAVDEPRSVLCFHGKGRKNVSLFQMAQEYDYVLTSYQTLAHEMRVTTIKGRKRATEPAAPAAEGESAEHNARSPLSGVEWFRVVLDEAHYARNARTQLSRALSLLNAARRWVVTATPMSNSVNDLFPLMQFMQVPFFSQREFWNANVRGPVEAAAAAASASGGDGGASGAAIALQVILSAIMLRRTNDTLDPVTKRPIVELPPKHTDTIYLRLTDPERAFYDALFEGGLLKLSLSPTGSAGESSLFATALVVLTRCRQACCHVNFVIRALQKIRGSVPSGAGSANVATTDGDTSLVVMTEQLARRNSELEARVSDQLRFRLQKRRDKKKKSSRRTDDVDADTSHIDADTSAYVDAAIRRIVASDATDSAVDASVVDIEFEEETKVCAICMDTFTRPTMLPCGHTFCFECIATAMTQTRDCPVRPCKRPCAGDGLVDIDAVKARAREPASSDAAVSKFPDIDTAVVGSTKDWDLGSKLTAAIGLMKKFPMGEKIIIFTQFASYAEFIVQKLNQRVEGDFHAVAFTGALPANRRASVLKDFESTPIEAPVRQLSTDFFFRAGVATARSAQTRPRHVVLVATVQTCGVGLNITCASRCIVMDPCWNPAAEAQATSRCHRIGQRRPVFIYRLITEDSIEVQIDDLARSKSAIADMCLSRAHQVQRMGVSDIVKVFNAALDADVLDE